MNDDDDQNFVHPDYIEWIEANALAEFDKARQQLAKQLTLKARDLDTHSGPQGDNKVKNRGERLSLPVYWRGRQWAATKYGVECRDGTYAIERKRLWEEEDQFGWIMHMAEKEWVDLEDFAEALRVARIREMIRTGKRWLHGNLATIRY